MNIKPIRTEQDYQEALDFIKPFLDKELRQVTSVPELLEILKSRIKKYECENKQLIALTTPVEAIKFRMEQEGLTVKDLAQAIGRPNRVYEILNGKRKLTLPMIRKLHQMYNIPLESLIY